MTNIYSILLTALIGLITSLAMGKTFRSLIFWPFSWLVRKLRSPVGQKVLDSLEKDAGIQDPIEQFAEGRPLVLQQLPSTDTQKKE